MSSVHPPGVSEDVFDPGPLLSRCLLSSPGVSSPLPVSLVFYPGPLLPVSLRVPEGSSPVSLRVPDKPDQDRQLVSRLNARAGLAVLRLPVQTVGLLRSAVSDTQLMANQASPSWVGGVRVYLWPLDEAAQCINQSAASSLLGGQSFNFKI